MFSPYYAAARRRSAAADPYDHVAVNAVLYGPGATRWAMTERGRRALDRSAKHLNVGPSRLDWQTGRLSIEIDEWTVPLPSRLSGRITVDISTRFAAVHALDAAGRHRWRPIAPRARVSVAFERPSVSWSGTAYVDTNAGDEPLERGFRSWTWSRAALPDATAIFYDVVPRAGAPTGLALRYGADGSLAPLEAPDPVVLPRALWRVARQVRTEGGRIEGLRSLEDAPFYTRSALGTLLGGAFRPTICESVDLDRFAARWVQSLLPFRMPRRR